MILDLFWRGIKVQRYDSQLCHWVYANIRKFPKKSKSEVIADIHIQLVFPLITTTSPQTLGEAAATDDRIILAVQPFRGDPVSYTHLTLPTSDLV